MPKFLPSVLRTFLATDEFEGLTQMVEERPAAQEAVLALAERALVALPPEEHAALVCNDDWCEDVSWLAEAAAAPCLTGARQRSGTGSSADLLSAVASLAACPELQAARGRRQQAKLLVACLELQVGLGAGEVAAA